MASTLNKNTTYNYCLEQKQNHQIFGYTEYTHTQYGVAYRNALPTVGITPSHMPRHSISSIIDISSIINISNTNIIKIHFLFICYK